MSGKNRIAGRYEVIQHIGQGGMADVFLAVDTILNRNVAVKILRADLSTDTVSILRFEREAQAATALAHPNIVEVYDVGDYKGHHYIVMEYVPGKTLKQVIRERGPLMSEEAVDIMKQLVSAISEAHKRGIIHRDIKPQNVIVKSDGTIKMLDFGIATAKGSMQLTQANNVMGSVHYLAPELAKGDQATIQSDIYAMGIVLYEMLAGDVPFKAEQAVQIALMHMRDPLPSVRALNPTIPQSLENIILKAAAKNPDERYQSADVMLSDLNQCLLPEKRDVQRYISHAYKGVKPSSTRDFTQGRPDDDEDDEDDYEDTGERKIRLRNEKKNKKAKKSKTSGRKKWMIAAGAVVILGISAFAAYHFGLFSIFSRTAVVPSLAGLTLAEAEAVCEDSGFVLDTENIEYELTLDTEEGIIISSDPEEGTEAEKDTAISVVVSSGIGDTVKSYVGSDIDDVLAELESYSNITVKTSEQDSDETPGTVLSQSGMSAGDLFDPDETYTITLVYSAYTTFTIPSEIIGMDYNEAAALLKDMGATTVFVSGLDSSTLDESELAEIRENSLVGTVKYSDPSVGSSYTQKDGSYITLYYYTYEERTTTSDETSEETVTDGE